MYHGLTVDSHYNFGFISVLKKNVCLLFSEKHFIYTGFCLRLIRRYYAFNYKLSITKSRFRESDVLVGIFKVDGWRFTFFFSEIHFIYTGFCPGLIRRYYAFNYKPSITKLRFQEPGVLVGIFKVDG